MSCSECGAVLAQGRLSSCCSQLSCTLRAPWTRPGHCLHVILPWDTFTTGCRGDFSGSALSEQLFAPPLMLFELSFGLWDPGSDSQPHSSAQPDLSELSTALQTKPEVRFESVPTRFNQLNMCPCSPSELLSMNLMTLGILKHIRVSLHVVLGTDVNYSDTVALLRFGVPLSFGCTTFGLGGDFEATLFNCNSTTCDILVPINIDFTIGLQRCCFITNIFNVQINKNTCLALSLEGNKIKYLKSKMLSDP